MLDKCGKWVEIKSQKVLRANYYLVEVAGEKLVGKGIFIIL